MSPPKTQRRGQRGKAGAGSTTISGGGNTSSGSEGSSSKAGPGKTTLIKQSSSTSSSSSSTTTTTTTNAASAREQPGRWNEEEHMLFLQGLQLYGKSWKKISTIVKTRTVVQIRTHAQKYLIKMEKAKKYGLTGVIMMDGKAIKRQALEEAAAKCAGGGNKATRTRRRRRRDDEDSTDDEEEEDERESSSMDEGDEEFDVDDEHTSYGSEEDRVILTRPRRRNRTRRLIKDEHPTYVTETHTHSASSTPSTTTIIAGYNSHTSSDLHTISPAFCPSTIPTDPLPLLDLPLDLLCDDADFLSNDTASCGGSDVSASTSSPSTLSCCSPYNSPLLTHSDVETHAHTHAATHTHTMDAFVLPSAAEGGVCVSHSHSVCVQPHTQQAHTQTQHTQQVVVGGCACARGEEKGVCKGACVSGCGMVGGEGGAECVSNTQSMRVQSPIQMMIMAQQGYPPHTTHAATSPTLPFHDAHIHTHTTAPHTQTHILPTTPISSLLLNDEHDALSANLLDFDVDVWMMDGVLLEDLCV